MSLTLEASKKTKLEKRAICSITLNLKLVFASFMHLEIKKYFVDGTIRSEFNFGSTYKTNLEKKTFVQFLSI